MRAGRAGAGRGRAGPGAAGRGRARPGGAGRGRAGPGAAGRGRARPGGAGRGETQYNLAMSDTDVPRRAFLRGVTAATAVSYSRVFGANDRVQLGVIGCGERGRSDMGKFIKAGNTDVVAVCVAVAM